MDVDLPVVVAGEEWRTGCYVDGWWGQYASDRLVSIACSLSWGDDAGPELRRVIDYSLSRAAHLHAAPEPAPEVLEWYADWIGDIDDACLDYLNCLIYGDVPMFMFGWSDGELFLLHLADWEEM
jgi:hypothetical protein